MTYTEFRGSFKSVEEFKKALGRLTEEEARAHIGRGSAGDRKGMYDDDVAVGERR